MIKHLEIVFCVVVGVLLILLLCYFNPETAIWMPKCTFYLITGYKCPSCGGQRAIYSLLHGKFSAAFFYNPFLIISVPYGLLLIIVTWFDANNKLSGIKRFCYNRTTIYSYLVLMVVWWISRNIFDL